MDRLVDFLLNFYGPTPYALIFGILLACGIGLPIPEDITLIAAGLLAYYGVTYLWLTILVSFLGVILGDSIIYYLGTHYGRKLTKRWLFKELLPEERLTYVQRSFRRRGNKLILAARFMPGLRAPIYFSAGTLHLPYRIFLAYDGMAALVSVPTLVGVVYFFGDQLDHVVRIVQKVEHGIFFVVFALVLAVFAKWYITHRKLRNSHGVRAD